MLWCVIPARTGSVGVPNKNWKPLPDGTTLTERALDVAARLGVPADRRILVTDPEAHLSRVEAVRMPQPRLCAEGRGSMLALLLHAMIQVRAAYYDLVMLLQPTSPFRTVATGEAVREQFHLASADVDSICTVMPYPAKWHPAYRVSNRPVETRLPAARQALPVAYRPDGAYYVTTVAQLYQCAGWGRMDVYRTASDEQLTIDTPEDWAEAERRIREGV